jgi:hypothetical protein
VTTTEPTGVQVREAVAALLPTMSDQRYFTSYDMYYQAAERLGVNVSGYYTDRNDAQAADRLYGQVRRALDLIASQGKLVKIGRGDKHPDGIGLGTEYYRPEAWEAAQQRVVEARQQARYLRVRWENVYDTLDKLGHVISTAERGEPIQLTLEQWENLAERVRLI